ncbi:MAG: endolytic transglycosylase MltG [Alphaproteobacteria bacterium]
MKRILIALLALVFLGAAVAAVAWWQYSKMIVAPQVAVPNAETLVVRRGLSVAQISARLHQAGAVDWPILFQLHVRLSGNASKLKAGEYELHGGDSIASLVERMVHGDVYLRKITVPEGLKSSEIVALLNVEQMLVGEITEIPADGSLLPETYAYHRGDKRINMLKRMQRAQSALLAALWEARADNLPLKSAQEALVLASIIEKETGLSHERDIVAGVFVNRLRKGMKLQTDPTVIYGVEQAFGEPMSRPLSRKDLATPTPYNTYVIDGLPPSPICNPGAASLRAALAPAQTDYLYFVADGSGGHAFAQTLAEHNRNVAAWRKIERARGRP